MVNIWLLYVIIWLMMVNNLVGGLFYPSEKWWTEVIWDYEIPNWMEK